MDLEELGLMRINVTKFFAVSVISLGLSMTAFGVTNPDDLAEGQCMAKVFKPAQYKTENVKVLKREASKVVKAVPAKWEWVDKKVEVSPAYTVKKIVPAKYETVTEKVVDKPAHTIIKKGEDRFNGDVMCKVAVPATYKTIRKRKMVTGPQTVDVNMPAKHKVIRVKQIVSPASTQVTEIPAKYQEYNKKVLVSASEVSWQRVLCKTNSDLATVRKLQQALKNQGYNPGKIDGVLGLDTYKAVRSFQKSQGLAQGSITYEALTKLGVVASAN